MTLSLCYFIFASWLFLSSSSADWPAPIKTTTTTIPGAVSTAVSVAQFNSGPANLGADGLKVSPINSTATDWWYFDAVDADTESVASVVVVFYLVTPGSFPFPYGLVNDTTNSVVMAEISGSFPNGTLFNTVLVGSDAVVEWSGDGSSGSWEGTGWGWKGNPTATEYKITFSTVKNNSAVAVEGSITFTSKAPGHYPCGPIAPNQPLDIIPQIGWSNVLPDADADVQLTIDGSPLRFNGVGYHDKNWLTTNFLTVVGSWFWGHGRLGPYSLVWFDTLGSKGREYVSAYVARDGKIVTASCSGIQVRGTGQNQTYPPGASTPSPEGFTIEVDLGTGKSTTVQVRNRLISVPGTGYYRWVGTVSADVDGQKLNGPASYEEFNIPALLASP